MLLAEISMASAVEEEVDEEGLETEQRNKMDTRKKGKRMIGPRQERSVIVVPFQDDWT